MRVPVLDRKLTLETAQTSPDGAGGFVTTWVPLGELWAELRPGTGGERREDFLKISRAPYKVTVRSAPEGAPSRPKPAQRFREGARIFSILAVSDRDDRGGYLTCFVEEEVVG